MISETTEFINNNYKCKIHQHDFIDFVYFPIAGAFIREGRFVDTLNIANKIIPYLYIPIKRGDYYITMSYNAVVLPLYPAFLLGHISRIYWFRLAVMFQRAGLLWLDDLKDGEMPHWFFFKYLSLKGLKDENQKKSTEQ